jgi:chitodextrinase
MKKQFTFIWKFLFPFAKVFKIILLLLFFIAHFNVYAEKIISRELADYPGGEVPGICATDYTDPTCVIILPPSLPGLDYNFQIPLGSGLGYLNESIGNCLFTIIQTTPCESGNMIPDDPGGNINMPAATRCKPLGANNYLEIEVNVNIISGVNAGQSDNQKYRLPIYRDPVKVALVLDISGSMGWPIPGGTEIRWNVLKDAVELFVEKLEIEQQVGDEIALTYFTTYVIQPNSPIGSNFIEITPDETLPISDRSYSIIKADMEPPRDPLYATAMGLGMLDGKSKLGNNDPSTVRKIALLFTDGLQNVNPKVNSDGITFNTVPDKLNDCPCNELDSVYYYPIGLGSSTLVPAILAEIADANGGIALSITTGESTEPEIHNFFQNQFTNMLEGGSPQIVGRKIGDLSSGDIQHSFKINNIVTRVFFELIHDEDANIEISIKKDGIDLGTNLIETSGDFYKIINVEFPIITDTVIYGGGEWEVTVSGESANQYYLTCFTNDHFLKYPSNLDASIYKTGDTIKFISYLKYAGEPLTSENDSVSVVLIKPGDDIGHLLATYATELTDTLIDYTDDAQNKLTTLLNNDESFYAALLPEEQVINLENNGNGEFSGYFINTNVTGVYQALFLIKGEIPSIGNFERIKQLSAVMEFGQTVVQTPEVVSDTAVPSTPTNLSATNITQSSLELNWGASTDDIGVIEYYIYKNGDFLSGTQEPNTNISVDNLDANTNYSFYIKAIDASAKLSDSSNEIAITTSNIPDVEKPTIPNNLTASDIAQTSLYLSWDVSTDSVGVVEYEIFQNGEPVASISNNSCSVTRLTTGTAYSFYVIAKDAALNESDPSNEITITTLDQPVDLSYPTKLTATKITQISLVLSWNASTGKNGDIKYNVYQDASFIGTATNTTHSVFNLKASTKYSFYVLAKDAEGNISDVSNTIEVTTPDPIDDSDNKYEIVILKIRPINKFGYYMGPGFKRKIKLIYKSKRSEKPIAYQSGMVNETQEQNTVPEPYLKHIIDNLDGSYYLVVANVLPKTNPNIVITIGDEVYYEGPINGKLPIWIYILIILLILIIIWFAKSKNKKALKIILWILLIILLVILYLHRTGFLNFL